MAKKVSFYQTPSAFPSVSNFKFRNNYLVALCNKSFSKLILCNLFVFHIHPTFALKDEKHF